MKNYINYTLMRSKKIMIYLIFRFLHVKETMAYAIIANIIMMKFKLNLLQILKIIKNLETKIFFKKYVITI